MVHGSCQGTLIVSAYCIFLFVAKCSASSDLLCFCANKHQFAGNYLAPAPCIYTNIPTRQVSKNGEKQCVQQWAKSTDESANLILPRKNVDNQPSDMLDLTDSDLLVPNALELNPQQFVYLVLTSVFITCLIVGDIVGVKLFKIPLPIPIFGLNSVEHTCGMLTFPITFLLGDVINDYFGPKAAKNTVYLGFAMSVLVFVVLNISQAMPYLDKPFNVTQDSFDMIFGSAKLMYVASLFAYLIGSLSDIWLFGLIKRSTNGKLLWLRATGSTVVSQLLDSLVVSDIAFSLGKVVTGQPAATLPEVLSIAATGYGLKFCLAVGMTPFLYTVRYFLKENYGLEPESYVAQDKKS